MAAVGAGGAGRGGVRRWGGDAVCKTCGYVKSVCVEEREEGREGERQEGHPCASKNRNNIHKT